MSDNNTNNTNNTTTSSNNRPWLIDQPRVRRGESNEPLKTTYRDMFKTHYKYRCFVPKTEKSVPNPFIAKEDINCDHKLSMTATQYNQFYKLYAHFFTRYLTTGLKVRLPHGLGYMSLMKYKPKVNKQFIKSIFFETGVKVPYVPTWSQGYYLYFKWHRRTGMATLKYRWLWRCIPTATMWSVISKYFMDNPGKMNNLSETNQTKI